MEKMRWLVGVDLRSRSAGAVHMASWLRAEAGAECAAAYVFEPELLPLVREIRVDEAVARAQHELRDATELPDGTDPFVETRVLVADSPQEGLVREAEEHDYDVLMIGRIVGRSSRALRRLGPVARKL